MPKYLVLYTINKSSSETQDSADKRRIAFNKICLANRCLPINGHQTAYIFFTSMTARELSDDLRDQAKENQTPLKPQDELFISEINERNMVRR